MKKLFYTSPRTEAAPLAPMTVICTSLPVVDTPVDGGSAEIQIRRR